MDTENKETENPYVDEEVMQLACNASSYTYINVPRLMLDITKNLFDSTPNLKYKNAAYICQQVLDVTKNEIDFFNAGRASKWKVPTTLTTEVVGYILMMCEKVALLKARNGDEPTLAVYDEVEGIWSMVRNEYAPAFCELAFSYDGNMSDRNRKLLKTQLVAFLRRNNRIYTLTVDARYEAVQNGIWDFEQQNLIDFETAKEQGLIFTNKLSTPYISNAQDVLFYDEVNQKWINIDSLISELLQGDKDKIRALWVAMHSMVRPHCSGFQKSIWLVDSAKTGGNGKSVVGELIAGIIGKVDTTSLSGLNESSAGGFSLSTLPSVLAIVSSDSNTDEYVEDSEIFKKLTTHDCIRINVKNQDLIPNYRWYGQRWFTFNGFPRFKDKSEAIDRRAYIIDFNVRFTSNKNEKIKVEFITNPRLHEYVLKRLLEMDVRKYEEFDFQKKLLSDFRDNSQPVDQFLNYICDPKNRDPENMHWDMYPYSWLWDAFRDWYAEENNNRPTKYGRNTFIEEVRRWAGRNQFGWEATMTSSESFTVSPAMVLNREIFTVDLQGVCSQSTNLTKWYNQSSLYSPDRYKKTDYWGKQRQIRGIRRIPTKDKN